MTEISNVSQHFYNTARVFKLAKIFKNLRPLTTLFVELRLQSFFEPVESKTITYKTIDDPIVKSVSPVFLPITATYSSS